MKRYFVDLKPCFNSRMVYPKNYKVTDGKYIGINNHFFTEENFKFGEISKAGVFACFERNKKLLDNIEPESQIIEIPEIPCDRISVFGYGSWGFYKEKIKLLFSDGSIDYAKVSLYYVLGNIQYTIGVSYFGERKMYSEYENVFGQYKGVSHADGKVQEKDFSIYYCITELEIKGRKLRQIVLPDNICVNIMAITLESDYGVIEGVCNAK